MAADFADDDVAELRGRLDAAAGAQRDRLCALIDAAARHVGVLRLQRARHVVDGQVLRRAVGSASSQTLICRWRPPSTSTWPTPSALSSWRRSTLSAYSVMSRSGLLAVSAMVSTGGGVRIALLDGRLRDRSRQQRQDAVDAVAHLLRGDVGVLLEREADDDLRHAFGRRRGQRVDAADGVDRFLDLVGDLAFDLLRRGAGQAGGHEDRREVDVGELIDPELREARRSRRPSATGSEPTRRPGRRTQSAASHCMMTYFRLGDADAVGELRHVADGDRLAGLEAARSLPPSSVDRLAGRHDALFDRARPRTTIHTRGARDQCGRPLRARGPPASGCLLDPRGGEEPGLEQPALVGHDRFDDQRTRVGLHAPARRSGPARERPARDRRPPRAPPSVRRATVEMNCPGTVSSTRSG